MSYIQSVVRRFVIEGEASLSRTLPRYDGKPFRLMMDDAQVCCGTWSDCHRVALLLARDWDTITSGAAAVDVPAWQERHREVDLLLACMKGTA